MRSWPFHSFGRQMPHLALEVDFCPHAAPKLAIAKKHQHYQHHADSVLLVCICQQQAAVKLRQFFTRQGRHMLRFRFGQILF